MGRRIEVELTSARDDGSWTWRAAGAKQPKGDVLATLLYEGAQVGDVVKVEAEFHLDGIEVVEVFAPKKKKERTDLLEMKSRPLREDEFVTTQRVPKSERGGGRGRSRSGGDRGDRGDRGNRGDRRGGGGGGERRGPKPEADRRPRPKRLRPRRVHRDALLAEVTEEHRPIVEQVMKDGMPGVRAAIEKQNAEAKAAEKPEIDASPILAIAERNLAKARLAEWRDRADAALADASELDIRDLRSVVVAGGDVARDDESRALVEQIKSVLDGRLESDHAAWLQDLDNAVTEGRVVRGLRLSSRPVKAGAPLPTEVAAKLSKQASDALAPDVMQDRWATVLDALAFSPVRGAVTPVGIPAEPKEELLTEVRRLSDRIPAIAALFGIDPAAVPKSAKRRRPPRKGGKDRQGGQKEKAKASKPMRPVPGAEKKPDPAEKPAAEEAPTTEDPSANESAVPSEPVAADAAPAEETQTTESEAPETQATESDAPESPESQTTESDAPAAQEAEAASEAVPVAEVSPESAAEEPAAEEATAEAPVEEAATEAEPAAEDQAQADAPVEEAHAEGETEAEANV